MTETSCGISAASHLSPMVDWADLDGALLISNDVFDGDEGHRRQGDDPRPAGDWREAGSPRDPDGGRAGTTGQAVPVLTKWYVDCIDAAGRPPSFTGPPSPGAASSLSVHNLALHEPGTPARYWRSFSRTPEPEVRGGDVHLASRRPRLVPHGPGPRPPVRPAPARTRRRDGRLGVRSLPDARGRDAAGAAGLSPGWVTPNGWRSAWRRGRCPSTSCGGGAGSPTRANRRWSGSIGAAPIP